MIKPPETPWLDSVQIRTLREADLPGLEWEGEYTHFRRLYQEAYRRQVRGLSILWVADLPGSGILGQVFIQLNCDRPELCNGYDRAYLYSFRVRPAFRGQGLGTRIMETIEADLVERGYRYLTLNVARENHRAQELYLRRGFRIIAPEPGRWSYMDEKGIQHQVVEPAWRMEKRLPGN